eukprot:279864-Chlamydomonas_euryale.AAC.1
MAGERRARGRCVLGKEGGGKVCVGYRRRGGRCVLGKEGEGKVCVGYRTRGERCVLGKEGGGEGGRLMVQCIGWALQGCGSERGRIRAKQAGKSVGRGSPHNRA